MKDQGVTCCFINCSKASVTRFLKVGYRGVGMASRCSNSINSGEKVSTVSLGLQGYTELLSTLLHVSG